MEEGISNSSGGGVGARGAKLYRGTWKREGMLAPRDFVKDNSGGGSSSSGGDGVLLLVLVDEEARKECHFRSHDTTGPAGHFALFLFSARRARPDLSTPPSSSRPSGSLFLSSRLTRGITNRSRTREMDDGWMDEWIDG